MMTMFPLFMLGMIAAMISQAAASAETCLWILDAQSEVVEKPGAIPMPAIKGRVAFEGVSFRYFGPKEAAPAGTEPSPAPRQTRSVCQAISAAAQHRRGGMAGAWLRGSADHRTAPCGE
jgi:ATP-binding cassette subfamily B protein